MGRRDVRALGDAAETAALARLEHDGLTLVARNFRCRLGEIDLVMQDGDCLVFVEVRQRQAGDPVGAVASIGPAKRRKLTMAAALFIRRHRRFHDSTVRFDVVAIDGRPHDRDAVRWLRDAFRPGLGGRAAI